MKPLKQVWSENYLWRENLRHLCYNIKEQNWDALGVNSGRERTGKSDHSLWQAATASDYGLNFDWENLSTEDIKNIIEVILSNSFLPLFSNLPMSFFFYCFIIFILVVSPPLFIHFSLAFITMIL